MAYPRSSVVNVQCIAVGGAAAMRERLQKPLETDDCSSAGIEQSSGQFKTVFERCPLSNMQRTPIVSARYDDSLEPAR